VDAPSLEAFKARLDVALGSLVWWLVTLHIAGGLKFNDLRGPFQPRPFSGSTIRTYYFGKAFKAFFEGYLLCDKCLFCIKGHETSALLILEKITDRNLINATNTALQTYVSTECFFQITFWCASAKTFV